MAKDQNLRSKLAVVTGASKLSGMGAATAIALAERGADVRLSSLHFPEPIHIYTFPFWQLTLHRSRSTTAQMLPLQQRWLNVSRRLE
jgi:hypothetical protein